MLILLPPSERKANPPRRGRALDLATLSWPELTEPRAVVLDALEALALGDATRAQAVLGISARMTDELERDRRLRTAKVTRAAELYTGVLYDALGLGSLAPGPRRWAQRNLVVVSALFGALRLDDRIPAYRLSMGTDLPSVGLLSAHWRRHLDHVLTDRAGRGLIVDLRSADYIAAWRPPKSLAERTVSVQARRDGVVVSHDAKHTRGLVARRLALAGAAARTPEQLLAVLAPHFELSLERVGPSWRLEVLL